VAYLQYRDKSSGSELRRRRARALQRLCERHCTPLIVNDDVDLARDIGAAGVHLGRDELEHLPRACSARPRLIVGVSCYNSPEFAAQAVIGGADYVAFGSLFPSVTKPHAVCCELAVLRTARARLGIPIVAIGGITPENGACALRAGADLLAVLSGLFDTHDINTELSRYRSLFD
jgi:thiamine-phosphate pyrophosphorylase